MIPYKIKRYINAGSAKNGFFYPRAVVQGTIDLNAMSEIIERNCSMKRSDVKAVLTEFTEVLRDQLSQGNRVKVDGLGSFKIGLKTILAPTIDEVRVNNIKGYKVNFFPQVSVSAGKRSNVLTDGLSARRMDNYEAGKNDKD